MGLYYVGLVALIAALVARTPWFAFFAFSGVDGRPPAVPRLLAVRGGSLVPTVFIAISQTGGFHAG